jgi:hypothetical protein
MSFKYFYEDKKKDLYYESDDKYEVATWILSQGCINVDTTCTSEEMELQMEILSVIAERFVNEIEEEKDRKVCEWCEELDETYQRHKEDYLFD